MSRPNKSLSIPDSLAADGIEGQGAKARCRCRRDDTPSEAVALLFMRAAVYSAQQWAGRYSLMTDDPATGTVEAADCLDEAADALRAKVTP